MAKPKSFVKSISIEKAKKAHNCQHNSKHRILAGDMRLKLKEGRTSEYFCINCALDTIQRDMAILEEIKECLEKEQSER